MSRNIKTREGYEFWDRLNSIPRFAFLLSPAGNSVQKVPDVGGWIDLYDAQVVMDDAQAEVNNLRERNVSLEAEVKALREEVSQLKQFNVTLNEENSRLFADWERLDKEVAALRARVVVPDAGSQRLLVSEIISLAAGLACRRPLSRMVELCEEQSRVSSARLSGYIDEAGDSLADYAADLRRIADELARLNGKVVSEGLLRRIDLVLAALTSYDMHGIINSTIGEDWREQVAAMRGELSGLLGEGKESSSHDLG